MLLEELYLIEDSEPFDVVITNRFKKGLKKHRHNKKVKKNLEAVLGFFKEGKLPPHTPPFKNHKLVDMGDRYDVHLDESQVILVYRREGRTIYLENLGSHREVGVQ